MAHVAFPLAAASHAAAGLGGWISKAFVMLEARNKVGRCKTVTVISHAGFEIDGTG